MASFVLALATFFTGWWEGLSWAARITYATVTLAAALAIVVLAVWIWEKGTLYLTTRRDQQRIVKALNNLGEDTQELDIITAAAIWAGTLDISNIERHTYFRGLKDAVNKRKIEPTNLTNGKADKKTKVDFESLMDYWRSKKIIP